MKNLRVRFWVEAGAAVACGVLAILTIFVRDWIEFTGWDPDNHSGAAEWWIVVFLGLVAVVSAVAARVEWRHATEPSPKM
jgi:hypothetical protein